jgi:hypothetical protein
MEGMEGMVVMVIKENGAGVGKWEAGGELSKKVVHKAKKPFLSVFSHLLLSTAALALSSSVFYVLDLLYLVAGSVEEKLLTPGLSA